MRMPRRYEQWRAAGRAVEATPRPYAGGMNVIAFLVSIILFVGSFLLFGYAFEVTSPYDLLLFGGGLLAILLSVLIPFQFLGHSEQR
jgi:hypothetical protein